MLEHDTRFSMWCVPNLIVYFLFGQIIEMLHPKKGTFGTQKLQESQQKQEEKEQRLQVSS